MISGTYLISGVLLAVSAWLFDNGDLTASSQTFVWVVIFGAMGPAFYGALIGDGSSRTGLFIGYLVGAAIMIAGGIVELLIGIDAEGKSLEDITNPLTATDQTNRPSSTTTASTITAAEA